jgi:uncharacterized protein YndB with AHSA1/START domain
VPFVATDFDPKGRLMHADSPEATPAPRRRYRMGLKIAGAVVAVVALLIVIVAVQPSAFRIARSVKIKAPPERVFEQVNDFHMWDAWSPWEKLDPNLQRTYSGADAGEGASYAWAGNDQVGEGKMTIVESRPGELVRIKLEFLKPFAATNEAKFTFEPEGDETLVTWSMTGHNNFMAKAFNLVMNMDKLIGANFEDGLASLKTVNEGM